MTTTELTKKDVLLESLSQLDFSNEPQFAQDLRTNAKNALAVLEFPNSKTEAWKYTRIGKITNKNYGIQQEVGETAIDIANYLIPELDANIVVIINGFYRNDLSQVEMQDGIKISSLKKILKS